MKVLLQLRFQVPFDDRLRYSVRDRWYTQWYLSSIALLDLHPLHWRRKITARGHAIPELVQIVFQIGLKLFDRLIVHTGSSPVCFYPFVRFPTELLGNTPRLRFVQKDSSRRRLISQ